MPPERIELSTFGLQDRRSATKPQRPMADRWQKTTKLLSERRCYVHENMCGEEEREH